MGNNNIKKDENNGERIINNEQEKQLNELNQRVNILEQKLLNKFAYPLDNNLLYYENIKISFQGDNTYLHTLVCGLNELKENKDTNKKVIIMLHGYQGNSLNFYKIIPYII